MPPELVDPVLSAIKSVQEEHAKSTKALTDRLEAAVAESKAATAKIETELKETKDKIRYRSSGGHVAEQEAKGLDVGDYVVRSYYMRKLGMSVDQAFAGAEFLRDEASRMLAENKRNLLELLQRGEVPSKVKTLVTTVDTAIGAMIPNQLGGFIDIARPNIITSRLGVRGPVSVTGGKLTIMKKTGKTAWSPTVETETPTAQDKPTVGLIDKINKGFTGLVEVSKQALEAGGPAVKDLIVNDLRAGYSEMVDAQVLAGSGVSGNAKGIINESTIGSVTTSGSLDWEKAIDFVAKSLNSNRRGTKYGWATNPLIWGKIMKTKDSTNRPIFTDGQNRLPTQLLGYPIETSTTLVGTTSNGQILFGPWDTIVVYEWMGGVSINFSDHYKFPQQIVTILGAVELDVHSETPEAFVKATDMSP